jgi:hypothetical protein
LLSRNVDAAPMAKGWKIISIVPRMGGGPSLKEYYLVAISDRDEAVKALAHGPCGRAPPLDLSRQAPDDRLRQMRSALTLL